MRSSAGETDSGAPRVLVRVRADVDGDGFGDVLTSAGSLGAQLHRGTRQGLSRAPSLRLNSDVDSAERVVATSLALVDLSGDGRAEMVIGEATANRPAERWRCPRGRLRVFTANATATEARETATIEAPEGFAWVGTSVRPLGDLDGDGDEDLLVLGMTASEGHRNLRTPGGGSRGVPHEWCSTPAPFVLRGGPRPTLERVETPRTGSAFAVARLDGDSYPELLVFDRQVVMYPGTSSGFAPVGIAVTPEQLESMSALAVGDIDGDGARDVIIARPAGAPGGSRRCTSVPSVLRARATEGQRRSSLGCETQTRTTRVRAGWWWGTSTETQETTCSWATQRHTLRCSSSARLRA